MSPWTAFLESMHSAIVDELTDRHPEPKPELGMPIRQSQLTEPVEGLKTFLVVGVILANVPAAAAAGGGPGNSTGIAVLACDHSFEKSLGATISELWDATLKRAGSEFSRRSIRPRLEPPAIGATLPARPMHSPQRMIWIPFKLGDKRAYFGVGV